MEEGERYSLSVESRLQSIFVTNWPYILGRTLNLFGPQFPLLQNNVIGLNDFQ